MSVTDIGDAMKDCHDRESAIDGLTGEGMTWTAER